MKRTLLLFALLCGVVATSTASVTMHLLSLDGPFVDGIPTYPYTVQFSSSLPIPGMCDDYYHGGSPGDQWQANLTNLGSGNLTYVRFAASGLDAYQEAAWILIKTYSTDQSQWPDMNYAVWHIFNPTVPIGPQARYWIDLAVLEHSSLDYSEVFVATPVSIDAPPAEDQEYLFVWRYPDPPEPPIPEPGSLILLGTGVVGIAETLRRRLRN